MTVPLFAESLGAVLGKAGRMTLDRIAGIPPCPMCGRWYDSTDLRAGYLITTIGGGVSVCPGCAPAARAENARRANSFWSRHHLARHESPAASLLMSENTQVSSGSVVVYQVIETATGQVVFEDLNARWRMS